LASSNRTVGRAVAVLDDDQHGQSKADDDQDIASTQTMPVRRPSPSGWRYALNAVIPKKMLRNASG